VLVKVKAGNDKFDIANCMIGYSPLRVKNDKKNNKLNQVNTQDPDP
jgi:hypothetical protein